MYKIFIKLLAIPTLISFNAQAKEVDYIFYISHHSEDSLHFDGKLTNVNANVQCGDWKKELSINNFRIQEDNNDNVAIIPIIKKENCILNILNFEFENTSYTVKNKESFSINLNNTSNSSQVENISTLKPNNLLKNKYNMILEGKKVGTNNLSNEIWISYKEE
ncbi:hypothetical protein [Silvanigrella sp.]|jgi:hypothetical protein|uniref:hypothetical protein n=1 Tax=Silvanigrella sp. TaxID=2024976 RepID=UPI0037C5DBE8